MINLVIKDLLIQKKRFLFATLYIPFLIFAFQGIGASVFSAAAVGFTYMLVMTSCAYEDKNNSDVMINSLPIKKENIVGAKYLSIFMHLILSSIIYVFSVALLKVLHVPIDLYPLGVEIGSEV